MACSIIVGCGAIIAPLGAIIVLSPTKIGLGIRALRALIASPIIVGDGAIVACCCCSKHY